MPDPGEVVLIPLPQFGGGPPKLRPALVLSTLPGAYQNLLISGISSQLHLQEPDWDELIDRADADYPASGLHVPSIVRLSFLYAAIDTELAGTIGQIAATRLQRLRGHLANHLVQVAGS
jgi:mRNA interferase MazF